MLNLNVEEERSYDILSTREADVLSAEYSGTLGNSHCKAYRLQMMIGTRHRLSPKRGSDCFLLFIHTIT